MNSLNEQSAPCQLRSHVHMSKLPHCPCPEHAFGHSPLENWVRNVVDNANKHVAAIDNFIFVFCLLFLNDIEVFIESPYTKLKVCASGDSKFSEQNQI